MKKAEGKNLTHDQVLQKLLLVSLIIAMLMPYASALKDMNSQVYQYYFATLVEEKEDSENELQTVVSIFAFYDQPAPFHNYIHLQDKYKNALSFLLPLTGFTEHELPPPESILT